MGSVRTIGQRYELRGELASGGMATVHLARQLGAGGFARIVAVKRLHERFARDPDFVAMFLDEARLVARIRHSNVVQTLDVVAEKNDDGGSELFIVMEYVQGESLIRLSNAARKKDEPIPLKIASAIMVGALHGLQEAHEAKSEAGDPLGIVHRDISPHNIIVGIDGIARVLDFGVAKATERVSSTQQGTVKGKLAYMAPEQLTGGSVDRRTDVFAAGIVAWEVLTGERLFVAANEAALVKLLLDAPIAAPSTKNGNVPAALDVVIMRSLARDPANRYATAVEFATALAEAAVPAPAADVGAWVRATAATALEEKTRLIAAIEAKDSTRNVKAAQAAVPWLQAPPSKGQTRVIPAELAETVAPSKKPMSKTVPLPASFVPPSPSTGQPPASGDGSGTRVSATMATDAAPIATPARGKGLLVGGLALGVSLFVVAGVIAAIKLRSSQAQAGPSATTSGSATAQAAACPSEMVAEPGGAFMIGNDDRLDARPAHKVSLHPFCIDRFEVSTADYKTCSSSGRCYRASSVNQWPDITPKENKLYDPLCNIRDEMRGNHPINCVDWKMATTYCEAQGKRLPTEAEWEYSARGGDSRRFPWGEETPSAKRANGCGTECVAWQQKNGIPPTGVLYSEDDGFPNTAPVGSFPDGQAPNGADDLSGNVAEWVADYLAPYERDDSVDPKGPESGKERAVRGGSWMSTKKEQLSPTFRAGVLPISRHYLIGFRCAKSQP